MHELARVTLQNEMDLILAHKRSMKLAELSGLSLSAQTTFATAVSEISRHTIEFYYISPPFRIDIHKLDEWRRLFRNEPSISPYEELKRKNEQLQALSEKVQKSEAQYKTLTDSLPMIIFSMDKAGQLLYANEWLGKFTGETMETLNKNKWKSVVYKSDYDAFRLLLESPVTKGAAILKTQARLRNVKSNDYFWHQISLSLFDDQNAESHYWIGYIVDIHAQKVYEETLKDNAELKRTEEQLKENQVTLEKLITELGRSNKELQEFAFVASHDLQEPVRKILYYSDTLVNKFHDSLDTKGIDYLRNIKRASQRMRNLIHDLLLFSQINRAELKYQEVDLNEIAKEAFQDLEMAVEEKGAVFTIQQLPMVSGDARMIRQLFENIISNSLKYAKISQVPVIDISYEQKDEWHRLSFKDNGIGFDEKYLPQMFTLFQRLHDRTVYDGTGLGLAICRKIVDIHEGKIWAEGKEGVGSVFFVDLPLNK
ncbi:MAG: PAS domain-containing sensor histidine kinase [Chitinophagaceae bacterium]|nr:MAG: PAS domain-containing sensor histidine kinase [Chitinophagaceae bacterium]